MNLFRNASIQRKLQLIVLLTTVAALVLAAVAFVAYDLVTFRRAMIRDLDVLADIIGKNSTAALSFDDAGTAADVLGALKAQPHVVAACLYEKNGGVFARYGTGEPPRIETEGARFESDRLILFKPVILNNKPIGTIYLQSDLLAIRQRLHLHATVLVLVMFGALLAGIALSTRLQRVISRPVLALAETARVVSETKSFTARAEKLSDDEIGRLTDSFNEMLAGIETRDTALRQAHEELEERVRQRTAELGQANAGMQAEIAERKKTEEALRETEKRTRLIVDTAHDAFVAINTDGKIIHWNRQAEVTFGWSRAEALDRDLADTIIPQHYRDAHRAGMKRYLQTGEGPVLNKRFEMAALHRHGHEFPVELSIAPVQLGDKVIFAAFIHDISERARGQRRIETQHAITRVLAESPTLTDATAKITKGICEAVGWEAGALWTVNTEEGVVRCVDLWHLPTINLPSFEQVTREGVFKSGVGLPGRVWADGKPVWISNVATEPNFPRAPQAAQDGLRGAFAFPITLGDEVLGVLEFFSREIRQPDAELLEMFTAIGSQIGQFIERKRAEEAQRDSEVLYHSLVESLPLNVLRKDREGRINFANRMCCETLGRSLRDIVCKTDLELFPRELAEKYRADDAKVLDTGTVLEDIEQHQKPDGSTIYVQVLKSAVRDAHGDIIGTQVMFWDVTDRMRAQEELKQTAAELQRSNAELAQFAYVASHDLQEPLRTITSFLQLLVRRHGDKVPKDGREFIDFAVDAAQRMRVLVSDLLTYSRVGTRGKAFALTETGQVVTDALTNLTAAIEDSQAKVTRDPMPAVMADAGQLTQLFQNLVGNALKYRRKDIAPVIHIGCTPNESDWKFSIADNGIGIEKQYFDRIFVIFQRLHGRGEYSGTGIGLAVCKKIVERHGGQIWLESEPGKGSTFFFTIPQKGGKVA